MLLPRRHPHCPQSILRRDLATQQPANTITHPGSKPLALCCFPCIPAAMHPERGGHGPWCTQGISGLSPPSPQSYPKKRKKVGADHKSVQAPAYISSDGLGSTASLVRLQRAAVISRDCVFSHASCVVSDQSDRAEGLKTAPLQLPRKFQAFLALAAAAAPR